MSNMRYCMFQNTLNDLYDCLDHLDNLGGDLSGISEEEAKAARKLIYIVYDGYYDIATEDDE